MSLAEYQELRIIGKGSYGEVWLIKHKIDRKQFVLKKMDLQRSSKKERAAAEQEAKLLSTMKHPNIVAYRESFEENGFLYIVMGFCEGGDLYTRLKEQKGTLLEEKQLVQWFVQITMALQYMHDRFTLHRDLKTQNIFLTKSNIIKVGDLGISRVLDGPSDMARTLIGTPYYMSPELFSNRPYNYKSDVWALGCCVYEMATLKHAFNARDMNSLVYKILQGKMPAMPKQYSAELVDLIKSMLNHNPEKRPTVSRILRDPYIKRHIAEFLDNTKKQQQNRPQSAKAFFSESSIKDQASGNINVKSGSVSSTPNLPKSLGSNNEKLEPLHVGPELCPITEESCELVGLKDASNEKNKAVSDEKKPVVRTLSDGNNKRQGGIIKNLQIKHQQKKLEDIDFNERDKHTRFSENKSQEKIEFSSAKKESPISSFQTPKYNNNFDDKKQSVSPYKQSSNRINYDISNPEPSSKVDGQIDIATNVVRNDSFNQLVNKVGNIEQVRKLSNDRPTSSISMPVLNGRSSPIERKDKRPLPSQPLPGRSIASVPSLAKGSQSRESGYDSPIVSVSDLSQNSCEVVNRSARERRRERKAAETPRNSHSMDYSSQDLPELCSARDQNFVAKSHSSENFQSFGANKQNGTKMPRNYYDTEQSVSERGKCNAEKKAVFDSNSSSSSDDDKKQIIGKEKSRTDVKKDRDADDGERQLIDVMVSTLRLVNVEDKSDEEDNERPLKSIAGATYVKPSSDLSYSPNIVIPVIDEYNKTIQNKATRAGHMDGTLTTCATGRLMNRISILRKDCITHLGIPKMKKAYDIMESFEAEELEPQLKRLLGSLDYDDYAGKLWQLKFCEEAAFGLI